MQYDDSHYRSIHRSNQDDYFLPRLHCQHHYPPTRDYFPDDFFSPYTTSFRPQFYIVRGYKEMMPFALQYVQHLSLTFNEATVAHHGWLSKYSPGMISLKDVTFNLNGPIETEQGVYQSFVDTEDFGSVIRLLKDRPGTLIVHTYLRLFFNQKSHLYTYLKRFENEWRQWRNLNIETLMIDLAHAQNAFPRPFCEMLKELTHLKRFSIDAACDLSNSHFGQGDIFNGGDCGSTKVGEWLKDLPSLEELSLFPLCYEYTEEEILEEAPLRPLLIENGLEEEDLKQPLVPMSVQENARWGIPPNVRKLAMPICRLDLRASFEKFDTATYLELVRYFSVSPFRLRPAFRNLKTLAFNGTLDEDLLDHFVTLNPGLVNLIFRNCYGSISEENLPRLWENITHMEVYQHDKPPSKSLYFETIIENTFKLKTLIYDFPLDGNYGLPFNWFQRHISDYSTTLETIQFRPDYEDRSLKMTWARDWCDIQEIDLFSPQVSPKKHKEIIREAVYGTPNSTLILDVTVLASKLRKPRRANLPRSWFPRSSPSSS